MSTDFYSEALTLRPEIVERRRDLHQHPELAFEEIRTSGIVAAELQALGLEVQTGIGKTGVVALLEGDEDGPTVLVRADMDALPIHEANETDYASTVDGKMHACGHDAHTSIGLAVAKLLSAERSRMKGRVKFVFQPAEEIGQGAKAMVTDGVLQNPRPDVSLGLHLWNRMPVGTVAVASGPFMSAADTWECVITGRGGHGASPHETADPIVAAAQIVTALQTVVSRNVSPIDTAVVTVGYIQGGKAFNVIPPTTHLKGTIRSYRKETKEMVHRRVREICTSIAEAMGCTAEVTITEMTLAVDNDAEVATRVAGVAEELFGAENVWRDERTMGSEDVSFLMDGTPSCFFWIGSANAERGLNYPHHNPHFDFDEDALVVGAALMARAVASYVLPDEA